MKLPMSEFTKSVIKTIKSIPRGKIATYGQIAELAGKPGASRGVSWILHSSSTKHDLPWHRVINAQGKISFKYNSPNYRKQKSKLATEGIHFEANGSLDINKFKWRKRPPKLKKRNLPTMFK